MTLIVEDGSIVENAQSYNSLAELRSFALIRGIALSADDNIVTAFAVNAMDYLESFRKLYQGVKVSSSQVFQFPREGVLIDNIEIESTVIPNLLKQAQCRLVMNQHNGVDLMPTREGAFVKKEVIGPITTEYSESSGSLEPEMLAVEKLLEPLFSQSASFALQTIRV